MVPNLETESREAPILAKNKRAWGRGRRRGGGGGRERRGIFMRRKEKRGVFVVPVVVVVVFVVDNNYFFVFFFTCSFPFFAAKWTQVYKFVSGSSTCAPFDTINMAN